MEISAIANATRVLFVVGKFMWADTIHISCEKDFGLSTSVVSVKEIQLSLHDVPFEIVGSVLKKYYVGVEQQPCVIDIYSHVLAMILPLVLFELPLQGIHRSLHQF